MRRRSVAAIGCLAFLLVLAGAAAASADVRILAPRQDQLVGSGGGAVAVRIAVGPRSGPFSARLERTGLKRPIPVSLKRTGGALGGRIPRAELRPGRNHLFVSGKGGVPLASSHFTVGRRDRGVLGLAGVGRRTHSAVSVRARVRRGAVFRAWLNGRPVEDLFAGRGVRRRATLAANDGLRFGPNKLVVSAFERESGDYRTIVRTFVVGRDRPLVGAGPDRVVDTGTRIRLDGSATRAGQGRLGLRWVISRAPAGSKARLRGARTEHPRLLGAVAGEYRLTLRATQSAPVRTGAATASAAPATAADTMALAVKQDVLPEGEAIETIGSRSRPAVQVGGATYPMANPSQGFAQLVVLDRRTLAEVSSDTYGGLPTEAGALSEAILEATNKDLVIVSGGGGATLPLGAPVLQSLASALGSLGVAYGPGLGSLQALAAGEFSVVGVPGVAGGQAAQMFGDAPSGGPAGDIQGFLRPDTAGNFTFAGPSRWVTFEVGSGTAATANTIAVGGHAYTETLAGEGFHLLWVDRATLAPLGQESVAVDENGMATLATRLQVAEEAEALVFLSSYGSPNLDLPAAGPGMLGSISKAARELETFGANRYAFASLSGKGGYSFVGVTGSVGLEGPDSAVELSQAEAKSPTDRITGELSRSFQGAWTPTNTGSPGSLAAEPLGQSGWKRLLEKTPEEFPPLSVPVQEYIFEKLFAAEGGLDPKFGLRKFYWAGTTDAYGAVGFERLGEKLANLPRCKAQPCRREFEATRKVLLEEFGDVATVKEFFESEGEPKTIAHVLDKATGNNGAVFTAVLGSVESLFDKPTGNPHGEGVDEIFDGALTIGEGVTSVIPVVGSVVSGSLSAVEGLSEIGEGAARLQSGEATDNANLVAVEALEWAHHIYAVFAQGFAGLRATSNLIVSDPARLKEAATLLKKDVAEGGLGIGETEESALVVAIERSEERYMWTTMLPLAIHASTPFTGPFNSPLPASGPASGEGVSEVNVPVGSGINGTVDFGYDIAPYVVSGGSGLLKPNIAHLLFGEINTREIVSGGPLGFRPNYFLSTGSAAAPALPGQGFAPLQVCQSGRIDDYEVSERVEESLPNQPSVTSTYIPCAEAEPPFSTRVLIEQTG